jgi:hypothetical protein
MINDYECTVSYSVCEDGSYSCRITSVSGVPERGDMTPRCQFVWEATGPSRKIARAAAEASMLADGRIEEERELIRLFSEDDSEVADALHGFFENHAPGDDWIGLGEEAVRLSNMRYERTGLPVSPYDIEAIASAVAAEAYSRGLLNAAKYLGVPSGELEHGVAELLEGYRQPLTGITIPVLTGKAIDSEELAGIPGNH